MDWDQIASIADKIGVITGLLAMMITSKMGWWEWRATIDKRERVAADRLAKCEAEVTEWKNMALRGLMVAEQATGPARSVRE